MSADSSADGSLESYQKTSSIKITKRTNRSIYMCALQHMLKPFSTLLVKPPQPPYPAGSPQLKVYWTTRTKCNWQARRVDDIYIYDLTAKHPASRKTKPEEKRRKKRIYYFAGGGWQSPASSDHWALCAELAKKTPDTTVSVVSYPLAPNSPAPVALPQLLKMQDSLLREAEEADETVIFAGDSAGGNIVLCLTISALLENENARCPTAILAISPSTDLSRTNPDIKAVAKHDPILQIPFVTATAKAWRGDLDACDPRISPVYADVSALARRGVLVHGVTGTYDILAPDAVLMREKLSKAGVSGEWLDWDKQMHVFPLTWPYFLPEGRVAKEWMVDVLRRC